VDFQDLNNWNTQKKKNLQVRSSIKIPSPQGSKIKLKDPNSENKSHQPISYYKLTSVSLSMTHFMAVACGSLVQLNGPFAVKFHLQHMKDLRPELSVAPDLAT
jgi:hypothetical protein